MVSATMEIGGKVRRLEERADGLWYPADPADQAELGSQGKPYLEWYEQSDFIKVPGPRYTMSYS